MLRARHEVRELFSLDDVLVAVMDIVQYVAAPGQVLERLDAVGTGPRAAHGSAAIDSDDEQIQMRPTTARRPRRKLVHRVALGVNSGESRSWWTSPPGGDGAHSPRAVFSIAQDPAVAKEQSGVTPRRIRGAAPPGTQYVHQRVHCGFSARVF